MLSKTDSREQSGISQRDWEGRPGSGTPAAENVLMRAMELRKTFGGQVVLEGVSLEVRRGEVIVLRGDNGSGKTTLINVLTGNLEADRGTIEYQTSEMRRIAQFPKRWLDNVKPFGGLSPEQVVEMGVGRTWQDVRLFASLTLQENISVARRRQRGENPWMTLVGRSKVAAEAAEVDAESDRLIAQLGLGGREASSGDKVSLGQAKRIAIARALRAGAEVLLLDEPLAGLDEKGIDEVMALLRELAEQHHVALVIVEHMFNLPRVLELATTVWTVDQGRLRVEPPAIVRRECRSGGDGGSRWLERLRAGRSDVDTVELPGGASLTRICRSNSACNAPLLEVNDVVIHRGRRLVVGNRSADGRRGVSFVLRRGDLAILQAPNGWGKTSLLEAISGLVPITCGTVSVNGHQVQNLPVWRRVDKGISFLQSRGNIFQGLTVREALRLARIEEPTDGIRNLLEKRGGDLSGGERQRVAILSALGRPSDVYLLDEPFSALDPGGITELIATLSQRSTDTFLIAIPSKFGESK